jgi:hypothetical protein
MNVTIGTPPQRFTLTIDSGSTDVWAPAVNSTGCAPSCPPGYGLDPHSSSSIVDLHEVFNSTFGLTPDLQVVGEYYNDTLGFSNAKIPNMNGMPAAAPMSCLRSADVCALGSMWLLER